MLATLFLFVLPDVSSVFGNSVVAGLGGFGVLGYAIHKIGEKRPRIEWKTKNTSGVIDFPKREEDPAEGGQK